MWIVIGELCWVASLPIGPEQRRRQPREQLTVEAQHDRKLATALHRVGHQAVSRRKTLARILARSRNVRFAEALSLAQGFGFDLVRISGSHHILAHPSIPELLNLQNVKGQAKPYQLRQMLELVERYNLSLEDEP